MTHSLHRFGSIESQRNDFVWFIYQSKGINDADFEEKARRAIAIAEKCGSENWGDVKLGCKLKCPVNEIASNLSRQSRIRGVFTKREQVVEFLKEMKEADLGLSVIISGLLDEVLPSCEEAELAPHTINYSLGVWGKKDLLPEEDVLAITSMCGHHMIAANLVRKKMEEVKKGRKSAEKAAEELAVLCPCGIFNQVRAARILQEAAVKA